MALNLKPNLSAPDEVYEALIRAHDGLDRDKSEALNARLILILINHIGDEAVIRQALNAARDENR